MSQIERILTSSTIAELADGNGSIHKIGNNQFIFITPNAHRGAWTAQKYTIMSLAEINLMQGFSDRLDDLAAITSASPKQVPSLLFGKTRLTINDIPREWLIKGQGTLAVPTGKPGTNPQTVDLSGFLALQAIKNEPNEAALLLRLMQTVPIPILSTAVLFEEGFHHQQHGRELEASMAFTFGLISFVGDVTMVMGAANRVLPSSWNKNTYRVRMSEWGVDLIESGSNKIFRFEDGQQASRFLGGRLTIAEVNAARASACFVAGTPLRTPEGDKPIEKVRVGDLLLSRSENGPDCPVQSRVVEEVFVRVSLVMAFQVNGRVIKTTMEHPFWVRHKGWVSAKELRIRDELNSDDGQWVSVEKIFHLNETATVYNVRIAEYHTYFVGSPEWGFSVWAHNTCYEIRSIAGGRYGLFDKISGEAVLVEGRPLSANSLDNLRVWTRDLGIPDASITRQYRGGRHGFTSQPSGDGLHSHHMPADSINGLPYNDGPAIQMEKIDHEATASHGRRGRAGDVYRARQQVLIRQGRFGEAIQMDIDNIRSLFGNKYDDAIREMLESLNPSQRIGLRIP